MTRIESRQNQTLRALARLVREKKYRRTTGLLVCEGEKLLREALDSGVTVKTVLLRADTVLEPTLAVRAEAQGAAFFVAEAGLFALASDVESPQGVLFSCESPVRAQALPTVRSALLLDGVQDPGNLGTILRTAEAFAVDAVILCEGCAEPTAPKVVRATMGAVFRQPIYQLPLEAAIDALHQQGMNVYAAALRADSVPLEAVSLAHSAVIIGSEGHGVSAAALERCDRCVVIPMTGRAESLNASVAAAILIWELSRADEAESARNLRRGE